MHALPLLVSLVDPLAVLFGRAQPQPGRVRFGDEPNPEARLFQSRAGGRRRIPVR